jgi:chloride channel protein, CIC family
MKRRAELLIDPRQGRRNPLLLAILSLIVGVVAGLLGAAFRLALQRADDFRNSLAQWAHEFGFTGFLIILGGSALATGVAAWMVSRFSPQSAGSGIPHVESQLQQKWSGNPACILPVKFFGGLLAIGSGLALGREGPSVHIGASAGHLIARLFRCNENECRVLLAAGAGAGLATAFNAPLAGAVFVLEELVGVFDMDVTIATIGASAGAISFSRVFLGQVPEFHLQPLDYPGFGSLPAYAILGVLLGFLGVLYSRAMLFALALTAKLHKIRVEWRAVLIGAAVGLLTWFLPGLVGGGDNITQQTLSGNAVFATLAAAFLLRFVLGPISYAACTPGGLFAPLLTIGSQGGLLFGILWCRWFNSPGLVPREFALVGMAALFGAVVRAPITGILLIVELTGSFNYFLAMLGATFASVAVATLLRDPPIYDSLRELSNWGERS